MLDKSKRWLKFIVLNHSPPHLDLYNPSRCKLNHLFCNIWGLTLVSREKKMDETKRELSYKKKSLGTEINQLIEGPLHFDFCCFFKDGWPLHFGPL